MPNEQEQFLKELEVNETQGPFEAPLNPETETKVEEKEEEVPESIKNRQHRRLEAKLREERESNIALAARLEALSEARKFAEGTAQSSFEEKAARIYGNATPENAAATELLITALKEAKEDAKREALEALREEHRLAQEEEKKETGRLDSMLEEIEDEHGIDLSTPQSAELRKGFFKMLEKLSPKDSDGNIIQYADHHAVWEELQSKLSKKTDTKAKDLASRSMVRSGANVESNLSQSTEEKWLRENGLI